MLGREKRYEEAANPTSRRSCVDPSDDVTRLSLAKALLGSTAAEAVPVLPKPGSPARNPEAHYLRSFAYRAGESTIAPSPDLEFAVQANPRNTRPGTTMALFWRTESPRGGPHSAEAAATPA